MPLIGRKNARRAHQLSLLSGLQGRGRAAVLVSTICLPGMGRAEASGGAGVVGSHPALPPPIDLFLVFDLLLSKCSGHGLLSMCDFSVECAP